jgi:2-polyprenyl-3-methyl-5-hydroxy-6-metoxy-1,4-benzoquinol methylase
LDVGSAGGEVVHYLRERGIDAHGIEPNEGFARYSVETYGVPVQTAFWQNARIDRESYDVLTANHVVEHFRTPFQALVKFRHWLKPGGHLYVSVPDVYSPHRTPYSRFHFAHLHYFDRESLIMMGLKAGFEVSDRLPGRSTTIAFRKTETPTTDWFRYPENYDKLARYFRDNTNLKYFLSHKPYSRWLGRMNRLGGETFRATFLEGRLDREKK